MLHLFIQLCISHYICDYALQTQYVARAKNRNRKSIDEVPTPWYYAMFAHSFIHAGGILLLTGSLILFAIELVAHFCIDTLRCDGKVTYLQDQCLHIACKALYVAIIWSNLPI